MSSNTPPSEPANGVDDSNIDASSESSTAAASAAAASEVRNNKINTTTNHRKGHGGGVTISTSTPGTPSPQDSHPYARGAVIEARLASSTNNSNHNTNSNKTTDWWSDADSSDDEQQQRQQQDDDVTDNATSITTTKTDDDVRLCDIIDRAQNHDGSWRYYIHYRDLNRRMDEWITVDRIVSPPSVGNAKARAMKRKQEEEERRREKLKRRQQAELLLQQQQQADLLLLQQQQQFPGGDGDDITDGIGGGGRRRRPTRRKSTIMDDDNGTVVTGSEGGDAKEMSMGGAVSSSTTGGKTTNTAPNNNNNHHHHHKEVVTAEHVTTHTVGEHVVATLQAQELDEHEGLDEASLREHEEVTKVKNVAFMELGYYQMETWYFSPLPKELVGPSGFLEVLYVCEFTLNLFARKSELQRFQARLPTHARHPPGNEIYRSGGIAMFEIDGQEEKIYSQNLCYIAKLFLDHKTLYFDVDPFLFYVLTEVDERGYHPVGYFSKEKYSDVGYNLACILTFPAHQRKGYGRFLIAFSYELSKKEEKVGSPEKPMSDLGQQAYKPYWASTIIDFLLNQSADESMLSVMDISKRTSIMAEDIVFTLNQLGLLKMINGVYFIAAEENLLRRLAQKYPIKKPYIDPDALHWTPFLTDVKRDKFSIHSKKASVIESARASAAPTPVPPSSTSKSS